jgi:predicted secreted protein
MKKIPAITVMVVLALAAPVMSHTFSKMSLASRDGSLILHAAKLRNSNLNLNF